MKYLRKKISTLAPKFFHLTLRCNMPELAGLYVCLIAKKMNPSKKYRVLCLGRSIFMDDVRAMIRFSGTVQYVYFHKGLLKSVVKHFIPSPALTERNYHVAPEYASGRKKTYAFVARMFRVMHALLRFDAVLSANFGYVDQQELFRVCRRKSVPAIVLLKEGIWMNAFPDNLMDNYQGWRFLGANMLVINEAVKRYMVRYISGVEDDLVEPVGIPRFDYYRALSKPPGQQVVLFSFLPEDYFLGEINETVRAGIAQVAEQFHRDVMAFARAHPACRVVIKTKVAGHYVDYVRDIYAKYFDSPMPDNLVLTSKAEPRGLIAASRAVLGFNSSTLVEALLAGRNIITPYFHDVLPQQTWDIFFMKYPGLVQYAKTYADLERSLLARELQCTADAAQKKLFFEEYLCSADTPASERAERAIVAAIENRRP